MLKPISLDTIDRMYDEAGLSQMKIETLHRYFQCFSNLYGILTVEDAYDFFRKYEGDEKVSAEEFYAFSEMIRDEIQPFKIVEMNKIDKEASEFTSNEKMIINGFLINDNSSDGYANAFLLFKNTLGKIYYMPSDKRELFQYEDDMFYRTECGSEMEYMIENMVTSGYGFSPFRSGEFEYIDIDGDPVKGMKLKDAVFFTEIESTNINLEESEDQKEKLRAMYSVPASEKIMTVIEENFMVGMTKSILADEIRSTVQRLDSDYGVRLSDDDYKKFADLYTGLKNRSRLWFNRGWSNDELFGNAEPELPEEESLTSGIQKLLEKGEFSLGDIEDIFMGF